MQLRRRLLLAFERAESCDDEAARRRLLTFVIVGGGPTGVEMAGALAELARNVLAADFRAIDPRAARILLVEAAPRILTAFPERLARYAVAALERLGAEVRTGAAVETVDASGVRIAGKVVPAANVVWCAGVRATPVAQWLDVPARPNGTVPVGPDLAVAGCPGVFVIGDAAAALSDGKPVPGLAAAAKQQGEYVASVISARLGGRAAPVPFRYRNWGLLATIGRRHAVADFGRVHLTGTVAWIVWAIVHIYYLIGFRNRVVVFLTWIWAWATYGRGARLILGEDSSPGATERALHDAAAQPLPRGAGGTARPPVPQTRASPVRG